MAEESEKNPFRIERRDALEAYYSEGGNICLKQEDPMGNEEIIISIEPSDVPKVIKWLEALHRDWEKSTEA